jgi:glycerol-3-phosphate acyltransferase PlsX
MKVALDAMGGEYAPGAVVQGAIAAARQQKVQVVLVGQRNAIEAELAKHNYKLDIVDASEAIGLGENPREALRNKRDSSIAVGLNLVKDGKADAFVSAGNTGAVMAAASFILKRIKGVERPALGSLVVFPWHSVLLLDVGANADCKPTHLVQFAQMGNVYMKKLYGIDRPKIGLLSNGEEDSKGNLLTRETHALLKGTNLNFIGNVEGNDIPRNTADVIVSDGFTGNVVLKTGEVVGEMVVQSLREAITRQPHIKLIGLLLKRTLRNALQSLDSAEHGGAPLLGVNGNVIIAHGHSEARAIMNAVFLARKAAEQGMVEAIKTVTS